MNRRLPKELETETLLICQAKLREKAFFFTYLILIILVYYNFHAFFKVSIAFNVLCLKKDFISCNHIEN